FVVGRDALIGTAIAGAGLPRGQRMVVRLAALLGLSFRLGGIGGLAVAGIVGRLRIVPGSTLLSLRRALLPGGLSLVLRRLLGLRGALLLLHPPERFLQRLGGLFARLFVLGVLAHLIELVGGVALLLRVVLPQGLFLPGHVFRLRVPVGLLLRLL